MKYNIFQKKVINVVKKYYPNSKLKYIKRRFGHQIIYDIYCDYNEDLFKREFKKEIQRLGNSQISYGTRYDGKIELEININEVFEFDNGWNFNDLFQNFFKCISQ